MNKLELGAIISLFTSAAAAQPATEAAAASELNTLANAMIFFQLDTTFFTTLENLDDVNSTSVTNDFQNINDDGGTLVIAPAIGDIADNRLTLTNRPFGLAWAGPYATFQSSRIAGSDDLFDPGTPLDPWGTPYYFYTPLGRVNPSIEGVDLQDYGDTFNDYRVVSLGSDRVVSSDDLIRFVSATRIAVTVISSATVQSATRRAGATLTIRGYNFGDSQGDGAVTINSGPTETVLSWSETEVIVSLATVPANDATIQLETDSGPTTSFAGVSGSSIATVPSWNLYN